MYSTGKAAKLLGVSFPTLKRWIYSGKIKAIKTSSGRWMIPESEIRKLAGQEPGIQAELMTLARIASWVLRDRFKGVVVKVLLFGSVARGEASEGSDVDLLVVVRDNVDADHFDLHRMFGAAIYDLELATGRHLGITVLKEGEFEDGTWMPLVWNAMKEGKEL